MKLRYRQAAVACRIVSSVTYDGLSSADVSSATVDVVLDEPQATTAPGQYAVFYDGDTVLAAGVIEAVRR